MKNTHPANRYLLGNEGYLGKRLHDRLKQMGYELWTPYRKNMAGAKKHNDRQLMAIRRTIESDFSLLTSYNAENNRARSLTSTTRNTNLYLEVEGYNLMSYIIPLYTLSVVVVTYINSRHSNLSIILSAPGAMQRVNYT